MSKKRAIAISLIVVIVISVIVSLTGNQEVHAETVTIDIPYSQQFSGGFQAVYSKDSQKNVTLDVPYNNGKIISKVVLMMDGKEYQQPYSEAVGKTSWTKTVKLTGEAIPLVTDDTGGTDSAKGYYAWYRYAQGDPHAPDWFSDIGGTIYTANNGPAYPTYPGMTQYPGTSSTSLGVDLTLSGIRTKPFKVVSTGDQWLDEASVDTNSSSFSATVNYQELVPGPGTVPDGNPDASTQYISTSGDINNFTVHYSQTFGDSDYKTDLGLPGAAMTIYYAAFNVIIHTNTYKYPDKLVVTYENAPVSPPPSSPPSSQPPTPTPKPVDGDFDIVQPTIDYRDSFKLVPKPFTIPQGCTYVSHKYRFRVGNDDWYTNEITNRTAETSFSYSDYPSNLIIGTNNVSIKITASCGDSGYIKEKPLVVNNSGRPNEPPVFDVGWFKEYSGSKERTRDHKRDYLVIGQEYDLSIVRESNADPEKVLPRDPEGDYPITFTWHFAESASPFIRSLGNRYGNESHEELFKSVDVPDDRSLIGNHPVRITAKDSLDAESSRTEDIFVYGPEPIADIEPIADVDGTVVKSRRPFPANAFDVSGSWSPLGRSIVEYKWENYLPFYVNDTDVPTYETVKLWVKDSAGLWSTKPATGKVKVLPDPPPIGKLKVPSLGIRNQAITIQNLSYSPDNDPIVSAEYRYKYDGNNNGFDDDSWQTFSGSLTDATFTPSMIGKYLFDVTVVEDYGKRSEVTETPESSRTLDVRNNPPEVSFNVIGENNQPIVPTATTIDLNTVLNSWKLTRTATGIDVPWDQRIQRWRTKGNALVAMWGTDEHERHLPKKGSTGSSSPQWLEIQSPVDAGFGSNQLSPYRMPVSNFRSYIINPSNGSKFYNNYQSNMDDYQVSKTHLYYLSKDGNDGHNEYSPSSSPIVAIKKADFRTATGMPAADWTIQPEGGKRFYGISLLDDELWVIAEAAVDSSEGEILVLDAGNGTLLRRFMMPSDTLQHSSKQKIFTLKSDKNHVVLEYDGGFVKLDRQGNEVARLINSDSGLPIFSDYPLRADTSFRGSGDDIYRYEYRSPVSGNYGLWPIAKASIVKIDLSTMTYAWRANLAYERPYYQRSNTGSSFVYTQAAVPLLDVGANRIYGRSFSGGLGDPSRIEQIDMTTGAILGRTDYAQAAQLGSFINPFMALMRWGGGWQDGLHGVRGADNIAMTQSVGPPDSYSYVAYLQDSGTSTQNIFLTEPASDPTYKSVRKPSLLYGDLIGDGIYLFEMQHYYYKDSSRYIKKGILVGTPSSSPLVRETFYLGQFLSPDSAGDKEYGVTMKISDVDGDSEVANLSFRAQDTRNRYAVEIDGKNASLSKYVNGNRTILASYAYAFENGKDYAVRVKAAGNTMNVWINNIPLFENIVDGTFASGFYGIGSEKSLVTFSNFYTKDLAASMMSLVPNYAIWEEGIATAKVQYQDLTFTDPENDPMAGSFQWSYTHTPKFLKNQGVSTLNGQTVTSEVLTFDKVGLYTITLKARDDPHPWYLYPNMLFDNYRKTSDSFTRTLIVHRRPIAQFSLTTNGDKTISWTDTSYDPDRYNPETNTWSPSEDGKDYSVNHGVFEHKYWYLKPSGTYVEHKLVRPDEPGEYTVWLMVKDEYGAWSYPVEKKVWSGGGVPQNAPPTVTLDNPNGAEASPNLVYTTQPIIQWRQFDTPGTIFQGYHVKIEQRVGGALVPVYESGELPQWTSQQNASWTIPVANILKEGEKYRVTIRVSDGESWSNWSNEGWLLVNAPPRVTITNPNGTKENPTVITGDNRPTISFLQNDDEYAYFNRFSIQILDEAGNEIYGAWNRWQGTNATINAFEVDQDLPTNQLLQARMWVSDNADVWSQPSNTVWFKINFPPSITMTNPSGTYDNPTMGSPTPTITWNMGDPDPNTVFSKVRLLVRNEDATVAYVDKELFVNSTETIGSYKVTTPLPAGEKVRVTAMVWDDNGAASPWATETWMLTNRPPTADFDWNPKPVWEGDTVHLINLSGDPDGDLLSHQWEVIAPDGAALSYNTVDVTTDFPLSGPYTVKLTVSDGNASSQMTKVVTAQPLGIQSDVEHTLEWLANHQRLNHNTTVRPIDFYSGEIFVVHTRSSPAPVSKAEAWIDTIGLDGKELNINTELAQSGDESTFFTGEIFDDRLLSLTEGLPKGNQTVHFRITYANGVIKEEDVPVTIIGNVREFVQVHRVK